MKHVNILNLEEEITLGKNDRKKLIHLEVFSKKAAKFIVDALNNKISNTPKRWRAWRGYVDDGDGSACAGGGLFIKAGANICMTTMNEVCILFGDSWRVGNYCRAAYSATEVEKSVKDKLAHMLKTYWKNMTNDGKEDKLYIRSKFQDEDNTDEYITEAEYSCLYNFLKGRDIIKKFKKEVINSIIGNKVQDQFVLSAIEVIKSEIIQKKDEMAKLVNEVNNEYQKKMDDIRKEWGDATGEIKTKYTMMIDELKNNMNQLLGIN